MTLSSRSEFKLSPKVLAEWLSRCEVALMSAIQGDPTNLEQLSLSLSTNNRLPSELRLRIAQFLMERGAIDQSLKLYQRCLVIDSSCSEAWFALGWICQYKGQFSQASAYYEGALIQKPGEPKAHNNLASCLLAMSKMGAGLHHAEAALILEPGFAEAHYNRALLLDAEVDKRGVRASYDRALHINPLFAQAWTNRGKLEQEAAEFDQALRDHLTALILHPGLAEAMHNSATVLSECREFERSITAFRRSICVWPDFANAHLGLSMTLLMIGRYLEGWTESEWRFRDRQQHGVLAQSASPRLRYDDLSNLGQKTVLLFWEHGLGDTLHFCRYARLLSERGAKVILNVQSELVPLIKSMDLNIEVTAESRDRPEADYHAYLMSLPHVFRTTVETIPGRCPYLFSPERGILSKRFNGESRKRTRVGLVVSGSSAFQNDHNRSIPATFFRDILSLPIEFHCLQKEIRPDDLAAFSEYSHMHLHVDQIKDFSDTASLVAEMDLVISVDTSVAHLAGAMAKPLWLLVAYTPDNRWFLDRRDSPWYPSARIYRQDSQRSYKGALAEIFNDLCQVFDLHVSDQESISG